MKRGFQLTLTCYANRSISLIFPRPLIMGHDINPYNLNSIFLSLLISRMGVGNTPKFQGFKATLKK
jgi:hypothetical protein